MHKFVLMGKKWQIAKLRKNIFKFLFIFFRIHWVKKNMFTFCSLSAHFAKRRNNLLTLHCRKRTSLLCTVKKPIYRKRASFFTLHSKETNLQKKNIFTLHSEETNLQKKNVFTFCSKEAIC